MYASIDNLRSQLGSTERRHDEEYAAKMLHTLPEIRIVPRPEFILKHVTGKRVLEFGASGPMHEAIVKVAKRCIGIDREDGVGIIGFDLDAIKVNDDGEIDWVIPVFESEDDSGLQHDGYLPYKPEIIICGEILEHLSNPGWFLTRLKRQYNGIPLIITVPNAFSSASAKWIAKGIENVNGDHVAWYSPKTISVLLTRAGYEVADLFFYNGSGPTAEGLIVVTE